MKNGETSQLGYILTCDQQFFAPYQTERAGAAHSFSSLQQAIKGDRAQTPYLRAIDDLVAEISMDFTPRDLEPLRRRLRELADVEPARRGRGYRISMSAGAAFMETGSQESLSELLDRADVAMYEQSTPGIQWGHDCSAAPAT